MTPAVNKALPEFEAIATGGDSHHIYIEAFAYMGNGKLHMYTGS